MLGWYAPTYWCSHIGLQQKANQLRFPIRGNSPPTSLLDFWINVACSEVSSHQSSPGSSSTTLWMHFPSSTYLLASTTLFLPCPSLFSTPHFFLPKHQTNDPCPSCDPHRGAAAKNTWLREWADTILHLRHGLCCICLSHCQYQSRFLPYIK